MTFYPQVLLIVDYSCLCVIQGPARTISGDALLEPIIIQDEANAIRMVLTGDTAEMEMRQIFTTACETPSMYCVVFLNILPSHLQWCSVLQ